MALIGSAGSRVMADNMGEQIDEFLKKKAEMTDEVAPKKIIENSSLYVKNGEIQEVMLLLTREESINLARIFDLALKGAGMQIVREVFPLSLKLQAALDKIGK